MGVNNHQVVTLAKAGTSRSLTWKSQVIIHHKYNNILIEKSPLLYLEVNLAPGNLTKFVVFEGDDAMKVVDEFCKSHNLNDEKK